MLQKKRLELLKTAVTKRDLADILNINISFLTRTLYVNNIEGYYTSFEINKRSGGTRIINAPSDELKEIQVRLSDLLLDCIDALNKDKQIQSKLSHGFSRDCSIITNAALHRNKKNVLNIDLKDFFDCFNFGRVRGFFIKNKDFELHEDIATVIAKIACYKNALPQGSPCSPVISNLITHSLDIRLVKLAQRNSATYSRYADDITFSTRKPAFSKYLVKEIDGNSCAGKKLNNEITRAGFEINDKKTRVQFKDSRQDVTGLIVNKKINTKSEYWRTARAMCHELFKSGKYVKKETVIDENGEKSVVVRQGTLRELEGILSFIDSVDKFNHLLKRPVKRNESNKVKSGRFFDHLNVREKTYSKFLFFNNFYSNSQPTVICEGKTDNVYLKSAISQLYKEFPALGGLSEESKKYRPNVHFMNLNNKTKYLMDLGGGASFFKRFMEHYEKDFERFKAPLSASPVILLLDNDDGPKELLNLLASKKFKNCPNQVNAIREKSYLHLIKNVYLVLTPLVNGNSSAMEDFFDKVTLGKKVGGKPFNPKNDMDNKTHYGKHVFSIKVVRENKANISFDLFKPILKAISDVMEHYNKNVKPTLK